MRVDSLLFRFVLFSVAVGSYASDHLDYGVPGPCDQLLDRTGFALGYSSAWKQPRWVGYRLTADEVTTLAVSRSNDFQPDPDVRGLQAQLEDYRGSGYDRGHNAPSADMKWSAAAMRECFYLSNMSPQDGACNSGIWNEIENTVRGFACAEDSVFVFTGPYVDSANPKTIGTICRVVVPDGFWKVIYDETPPCKMIGFIVPNRPCPGKPFAYACSVSKVEQKTGLRFFSTLPSDKRVLKNSFNVQDWDWSKSQKPRVKTGSSATGSNRSSNRYGNSNRATTTGSGPRSRSTHAQNSSATTKPCTFGTTPHELEAKARYYRAPDAGDCWLSVNSDKRHNKNCPQYEKSRGRHCHSNEGIPAKCCGG